MQPPDAVSSQTTRKKAFWHLDWPMVLGGGMLLFLGLGILFLARLAVGSLQAGVPFTARLNILVAAVGIGLWASLALLFISMISWRRRMDRLAQEVERYWLDDAIKKIEHRLEEVSVNYLERLTESMASVQQSVAELKLRDAAGVTWLESLYHVFTLLNEADDEDQLCDNISTAFAMLDGYAQVMLFLGEHELGPLFLVSGIGLPPEVIEEWQGKPWRPPLWGVVAPALAKRKPFVAEKSDTMDMEFPWEVKGDYIVALPLVGINTLQGVVVLVYAQNTRPRGQIQTRLLEIVAWFAGRSLEGLRLVKGLQEHMTELVTVQSLTRSVVFASSLEDILTLITREITGIAGPSDVALILAEDMDAHRVRCALDPDSEEYQALMESIDWKVVRWVHEAVQPVFYTPGHVSRDVGDLMFETTGKVMVVPLEGKEEILGVLIVRAREPDRMFEEPHLVGVRTIASAAVVGIYAVRQHRNDDVGASHPITSA